MDNRISCNACNCKHHTNEHTCTAEQIKVGNSTAVCSSETCCDTFTAKN